MLSALRGLGVKNAVMLTGDSPRTAAAIAKKDAAIAAEAAAM